MRPLCCPLLLVFCLAACAVRSPAPLDAGQHLGKPAATLAAPALTPVAPALPRPQPLRKQETYSLVVSDVDIRSLLFALGRDARMNVDVHPELNGRVTINALNQTLPQLMTRLARQVPLRWSVDAGVLHVEPDAPYLQTYKVDYLNVRRAVKSSVAIANTVSSTGGSVAGGKAAATPACGMSGSNASCTLLDYSSDSQFWSRLEHNLQAMLGLSASPAAPAEATRPAPAAADGRLVVVNPETGLVLVRASQRDQQKVAAFLAQMQLAAQRQVLIEATIVEVTLGDQYQAGVDWSRIATGQGWSFGQNLLGQNLAGAPAAGIVFQSSQFELTVKLLEQFGRTRVLSSPKLIALNNQTAIMKVVEEQVYFSLELDEDKNSDGEVTGRNITSTLHTVPVGLVMQVTPQIADSGLVALNVRPTITNVSAYVEDPAVALIAASSNTAVKSLVPVLQVREFDSTLNVPSGQVAVLGGLIQDAIKTSRQGVPGLSRLPTLGDLFSFRDDKAGKSELVVFLRPLQIREASVNGDLAAFKGYMPDADFMIGSGDHTLSAYQAGAVPLPAPLRERP
ncbi:pilus (MSHA type) biogenesis protein MshL [Chitinilyticum litopenaei]|uniref:pilus (MSHA type) biogenesis protein MshL n=1 Tax=Chitinilyticum litopenaei TaxID=1121276 RepID=UPI0009DB9A13|nr:pilus (MSHA type) biogenesis protein MshL [Chitinilyticum litopenaei]